MSTPHIPDPSTDLEGDSLGGAPSGRPVGREGARVDIEERKAWYVDGLLAFFVALVIGALATWQGVLAGIQLENNDGGGWRMFLAMLAFLLSMVMFSSLTIISPGDTKVIQFFGRYIGTIRNAGLLHDRAVHDQEEGLGQGPQLRDQRAQGQRRRRQPGQHRRHHRLAGGRHRQVACSPSSSTTTSWPCSPSRRCGTSPPPTPTTTPSPARRPCAARPTSSPQELADEVAARIAIAGLEVVETRISSLAYAPEIAQAMLQRQQASAVIAAREKIVEGAVTMVQNALRPARGATTSSPSTTSARRPWCRTCWWSSCSDSRVTPVVNTGSLYT